MNKWYDMLYNGDYNKSYSAVTSWKEDDYWNRTRIEELAELWELSNSNQQATINSLKREVESLEEELKYYKTSYYKRLLNKIKPFLNIRFKVIMYSKD